MAPGNILYILKIHLATPIVIRYSLVHIFTSFIRRLCSTRHFDTHPFERGSILSIKNSYFEHIQHFSIQKTKLCTSELSYNIWKVQF